MENILKKLLKSIYLILLVIILLLVSIYHKITILLTVGLLAIIYKLGKKINILKYLENKRVIYLLLIIGVGLRLILLTFKYYDTVSDEGTFYSNALNIYN